MKQNVTILGAEVLKSGVNEKTKKAWSLIKFHISPLVIDGDTYETFTSFNGHQEGPTQVDLEVNVNGQWKNLREVAPKSKLAIEFDELKKRITTLEKEVAGLKRLQGV